MATQASRLAIGEFPSPIVIPPLQELHDITIIFLHGRGFNAHKFHGPLLQTTIGTHTFQEALPHARFVFPTAPLSRATKYRRTLMHQWYDGTGDWEPDARGGMRPSIEHIHHLIRRELEFVGGDAKRIILADFSQGCAMALMCMLLWEGESLGALVGLCGFMPLTSHLLTILDGEDEDNGISFETDDDIFDRDANAEPDSVFQMALNELREEAELPEPHASSILQFSPTPVFLGHGTADPEVDIQHASQAAALLRHLGMNVDFNSYKDQGHWYSAAMLSNVVQFLAKHLPAQESNNS